ncbi:MAG: lipoprotein signal peptidase [Bacteroidales bacterium]|nr:lipoprotein signal peptidase [Bacteroidales bacterium]
MKKKYLPLVIIGVVLLLDQTLKFWVKTNMLLGQEFVIFSWFRIFFLENDGMAFGLTFGGAHGKLILSLLRIVVVIGIIWWIYDLIRKNESRWVIAAISLVAAGALGNIIDGTFYGLLFSESGVYGWIGAEVAQFLPETGGYAAFLHGNVVDMFYFPLFEATWPQWFPWVGGRDFIFFSPVFNIADSAIFCGVVLFFITQIRQGKVEIIPSKEKKAAIEANL